MNKLVASLKKQECGSFVSESWLWFDSVEEFILTETLGFCGCGNPEEQAMYVRDMLSKHVETQQCWGNTSYEDQPVMFFLQWAEGRDLSEHGCTIRCSWLTEKGKDVLSALIDIYGPACEVKDAQI